MDIYLLSHFERVGVSIDMPMRAHQISRKTRITLKLGIHPSLDF